LYPCDYEIGLSIIYGKNNKDLVESLFSDYTNINLIYKEIDNLNRGTYSAMLKQPQFYENFKNWSHVLIYQTDALIFRKIPDFYFNYDYIGAPWIESNQWCKYNAGNGGFSLRNVNACIKACEKFRDTEYEKIPRGNEDGFFCNQDSFKYPEINSESHKAFAVERVKHMQPVGCHQIYHGGAYKQEEWELFISYMRHVLLDEDPEFDLKEICAPNKISLDSKLETEKVNKEALVVKENTEKVPLKHIEKIRQKIGPFYIALNNKSTNNWRVECTADYEILICKTTCPSTALQTFKIDKKHEMHLHKKAEGGYYFKDDNYLYMVFSPGYPNGTQAYADVRAPWNYVISNECNIPKNGSVLVRCPIDGNKEIVEKTEKAIVPNKKMITNENLGERELIKKYNLEHIDDNILIFDLFSGVGYYNQLFSFEQAVYFASISGRYLIVNIRHPLSACGRPNRDYGPITEYITTEYKKYLKGIEIRLYEDSIDTSINELKLPSKMSSCVIIDDEYDLSNKSVKEFIHYRMPIKMKDFGLLDETKKIVTFKKSNASRIFYNIYTNKLNVERMNKICYSLSKYNENLIELCKQIMPQIHNQYIGIHLRLGDWHKTNAHINSNSDKIYNNIHNWLIKNNKYNLPIYILTDRDDSNTVENLKKSWNLVNVESFVTEKIKQKLKEKYNNTIVAEFVVQKYILENSTYFIGSQGSTVSVHINYVNYLNKKTYELYTTSNNINYDPKTLMIKKMKDKNNGWSKRGYSGGHPTSWSFFFEDNILIQ
jgi:hypothetical protein